MLRSPEASQAQHQAWLGDGLEMMLFLLSFFFSWFFFCFVLFVVFFFVHSFVRFLAAYFRGPDRHCDDIWQHLLPRQPQIFEGHKWCQLTGSRVEQECERGWELPATRMTTIIKSYLFSDHKQLTMITQLVETKGTQTASPSLSLWSNQCQLGFGSAFTFTETQIQSRSSRRRRAAV